MRTIFVYLFCLLSLVARPASAGGDTFADWAAYGKTANVSTTDIVDADVYQNDKRYTIKTARGLAWIAFVTNQANTTTANYPTEQGFSGYTIELANDIDLADASISVTNKSWIPIGKQDKPFQTPIYAFKGTFNGKGHMIKGLTITSTNIQNVGLFGYVENGTIQNLGLELSEEGIQVSFNDIRVGGIVGYFKNSTLNNCYISGEGDIQITATPSYTNNVGGIVGWCVTNNDCKINNCYSTIDIIVTGDKENFAGGISGRYGNLTACYATGSITGQKASGISPSGIINSCLALNATIAGNSDNVYRVGSMTSGSLKNYASPNINITNNGAPITDFSKKPTYHGTDCHSLTPLTFLGDGWDISGDKLPCLKMKKEDGTYTDWPNLQPANDLLKKDFIPNPADPASWIQVENANIATTDHKDLDIWLENDNIYHIKTAFGLAWISYIVRRDLPRSYDSNPVIPVNKGFEGCTVVLDNDIDLSVGGRMTGKDWLPIGYNGGEGQLNGTLVSSRDFKGTFDGKFHTVSNMTITKVANEKDQTSEIYLGLFGYTRNGQIKNLNVEGSITLCASSYPYNKTQTIYAGGIAGGLGVNGSITNSTSSVSINVSDDAHYYYAGGIAGVNGWSIPGRCKLENVYSTGDVIVAAKQAYAGGITSYNKGDVLNCYSTSNVKAEGKTTGYNTYAGGLVGWNSSNDALIKNSFATGSVLATNNFNNVAAAGGICGQNSSKIENCLALNRSGAKETAAITGKSAGRVGYSSGNFGLETCYASTLITLQEKENTIATPTEDRETSKKNGADVYVENVAAKIAAWVGENKAFTLLGSTDEGFLPQLKIKTGDNTYSADLLKGQPDLKIADHLAFASNLPLTLPGGASVITLSNASGIWTQKNGDNEEALPFNGTIVNTTKEASDNALFIASAKSEPALTLKDITIVSIAGTPLCNAAQSIVTVKFEGTNSLSSKTYPCLSNQGSLQTILAENGSCNLISGIDAIKNTGTLKGGWLEWEFETAITADNQAIVWKEVDGQTSGISGSGSLSKSDKAFGVLLPSEKSFTLTVEENPWKAFADNQKPTLVFTTGNDIATTYTQASELKNITISKNEAYNETYKNNRINIEVNGIFAIGAEGASIFSLNLQPGGQVTADKQLTVYEDFTTNRTLNNKWSTFASPVEMRASVENTVLYTASGYWETEVGKQSWDDISSLDGVSSADLEKDRPYLIASEADNTTVSFKATNVTIPEAQTITLGESLDNGIFLFTANNTLQRLDLENVYVLNTEKNRFDLVEGKTTIQPMEAFAVANAVTRSTTKSLLFGNGTATGNEPVVVDEGVRVWGTQGTLHISLQQPADVTIFSASGQILRQFPAASGKIQLSLSIGFYFIHCNQITYKIRL